jgi:hypothetical protein
MNNKRLLAGAGIGAALGFLFDPSRGGRRRALLRDKCVLAVRKTRDGLDAAARDMAHRTQGIAAEARGRLSRSPVDDVTLLERVRSRLGRATSHPRAIDVEVDRGEVTLRGPILADEVDALLSAVESVRGVCNVINELEPHEETEAIPSLQGRRRARARSLDLLQRRWAPATRALVGAAGVAATGLCVAAYARR